jgi:hypothetical protein
MQDLGCNLSLARASGFHLQGIYGRGYTKAYAPALITQQMEA